MAEQDLWKRYIDEGDMLLGRVLETEEGRQICKDIREEIEWYEVGSVYEDNLSDLTGYAERHLLKPDDAKIIAWAMVQKALTDLIHEELSE